SEAMQHGHAATAEHLHGARLHARVERELDVAVERRHGHRRAERCLHDRQVDLREDVVPLAHEPLVRTHAHEDVQIAGPAAERARVPCAGEADALAVVDPRGDLDVERPLVERAAGAAAGLARVLDDPAGAAALRARHGAHELAEDAARDLLEPPGTAAAPTGRDARAGLDAVAAAGPTLDGGLDGHARSRPARRVDELDLDLGRDVAAARRAAAHAGAEEIVAEERAEEVADVAEVEVARREAARAQA